MKKRMTALALAMSMTAMALTGCAGNKAETAAATTAAETTKEETMAAEMIAAEYKGSIAVTYVKSPLNVPSIVEKDQKIFEEAFKLFAQNEEIQSPEDLRGKKVAGPKGTILHELLVAYIASANMTEEDIEFLAMGIPDAQAALAGGSVDAALLAGLTAYNMEKDGFYVVTDGTGLTEATIVVATSGEYAESHLEEVQTFLEAQQDVLTFIEENQETAMEVTAEETELTPEAVAEMYPMYDFDMTIKDSDIAAMEKTEAFMYENAMIEEHADIEDLILVME